MIEEDLEQVELPGAHVEEEVEEGYFFQNPEAPETTLFTPVHSNSLMRHSIKQIHF